MSWILTDIMFPSGRKKKRTDTSAPFQGEDIEANAERCLSRAWAAFSIGTYAILCVILTIRTAGMHSVWRRTQCPRVGIHDNVYGIKCGSTTEADGQLPLAVFPLVAAYIALLWNIVRVLSWRANWCDFSNSIRVLQGAPQSLCSTIIFPLLLPPIVYFGIQPCLTTILTFCFLELILRWVWYTTKNNTAFATSMFYIIVGNAAKFVIIYSYISYSEMLQSDIKAFVIVDLVFTLIRAFLAIAIGRPTDDRIVAAEWVATVLQHLQFLVLCIISGNASILSI